MVNPLLPIISGLGINRGYRRLKHAFTPTAAILMYHCVRPGHLPWSYPAVSTEVFERQMLLLKNTYTVLPLDTFTRVLTENPEKIGGCAAVTFDDGYKDNYTSALPVLQKYHIPATVFLTTGHIGSNTLFWWDRAGYCLFHGKKNTLNSKEFGDLRLDTAAGRVRAKTRVLGILNHAPDQEKTRLIDQLMTELGVTIPPSLGSEMILSWEDVAEMSRQGIQFGAHTVHHPILTHVDSGTARSEILDSKKTIEDRLGEPVTAFSYPHGKPGDINKDIVHMVQECGFRSACTTVRRLVSPGSNLFTLERVSPGYTVDEFDFMTSGIYTDLYAFLGKS